jgi:regulatory protein
LHATKTSRPRPGIRLAALRLLAQRRLTESQLWSGLAKRGYEDADIRAQVEMCKADGYVDDRLFARLFVDGRRKALGDARLVAELVGRGIAREAAAHAVAGAAWTEERRLDAALENVFRARPGIAYAAAARSLERLGFAAAAIYRRLRERAKADEHFTWEAVQDECAEPGC